MHNFQLIGQGFDMTPLLVGIKRQPELWQADTFLRDYPQGPFGETESIMLRFPRKTTVETQEELEKYGQSDGQHESVNRPELVRLPEAVPMIFALMAQVRGERLGRVMINKVCPGGRIFRHADTPEHCNYYSRFHAVLQTSPGALLHCGDEVLNLPVGTIWWFNNKLEHEVVNNGSCDRIHMVIDIRLWEPPVA